MSEEGEIKGRLTLNSDQFKAAILAAKAELDELTSTKTDVTVRADTAAARQAIDATDRAAKDLGREAPKIIVKADANAARAQLEAVRLAATSVAAAESRLQAVQKDLASSAARATVAEAALTAALAREDAAATRAITAEHSLERAHEEAAAAAVEHAAAEETVEGAIDRVSRRADSGSGQIALWTTAIVAAVPALFPIAGVATAGAVALGGLGAAGVLAGTGLARGAKDGSGAYSLYRPIINQVLADVRTLQDTAAVGLLPGAQETLHDLQADLPMVNRGVAEMADDLGRMLPTGLDAVVTLTKEGVPLWRSGADMLARMVQGIDDFAHSDSYKGFIDYSVRNGPRVESFLEHTLQLVGDIITAWAPYGEAVLPVLDDTVVTVGQLIKALGPVVPAVAAVYLAFRAYTGIRGVIDGITTGMSLLGVTSRATAGEVTAAGAASKAASAGAAAGWTLAAIAATQYATALAGQQNYAQAEKLTPGSPQKKAEVAGMASRASSAAPQTAGGGGMDVGLGQMFDQMEAKEAKAASGADGVAAAQKRLAAQQAATQAAITSANVVYAAQAAAANNDAAAITKASTAALQSEQNVDAAKDAISALTAAVKTNGTSLSQNTEKGRANREAFVSAVSGIQAYGAAVAKTSAGAAGARVKMDQMAVSLVNTAVKAGISRTAAERLVDKLMGFPKGVTTEIDLKRAKAEAALTAQKKALAAFANGDYTAALKADPSNMKAKVADAQKRAEDMAHANYLAYLKANPGNANSNTADAAKKARAFAAGAYSAAIRADAAQALATIANVQQRINAIYGKSVTVTVNYATGKGSNTFTGTGGMAHGGTAGTSSLGTMRAIRGLASGTISGPGGAASDLAGIYRLANGEEVTSNLYGQASKNRPMLKAINSGDSAKIRQTAQEQYGTGQQQPVTVIVQARDGAPDFTDYVDIRVVQGVKAQSRENQRVLQAGRRNRGL